MGSGNESELRKRCPLFRGLLFKAKLVSRGIRDFQKRKTIFTWIKKHKVDIAFLQETYSSQEIKHQFKLQWRGKMMFAHGTNHSKGVLILFIENLQIDIRHVLEDDEGRYIFVEALVQDAPLLLVNLYAPTQHQEQFVFFDVFGQCSRGFESGPELPNHYEKKKLHEIMRANDLIDIWRIRNPEKSNLLGRRKSP